MNEILMKLIAGDKVEDEDISWALYEICDSVHASCDNSCPVFKLNYGIPWLKGKTNCRCFKDGKKMLDFLRENKR